MTLKRVYGPYTILGLNKDMVYGPLYIVWSTSRATVGAFRIITNILVPDSYYRQTILYFNYNSRWCGYLFYAYKHISRYITQDVDTYVDESLSLYIYM